MNHRNYSSHSRLLAVVSVVLAVLLSLSLLPGCQKDKTANQIIRYNISTPITNLDPQYAKDPNEILVILNCFEGLMRRTEEGQLVPAAALDYTLSEDGLTYTFSLRQDAFWSNNDPEAALEPVTAQDFVFAFQRLFEPSAPSPYAQQFKSIRNASQVLSGQLPPSQLGVWAKDRYSLTIQLEQPNSFFLELLASSAAMPCQESFFTQSKGRYGLSLQNLQFNGCFSLSSWDNQKYIGLRRNSQYYGASEVIPLGVNLYIGNEMEKNYQLLDEDRIDAAPVSAGHAQKLREESFVCIEFPNIVYLLLFNIRNPVYANDHLRVGLSHSINRALLSPYLPERLTLTAYFFPPAAKLQALSYRQYAGEAAFLEFDSSQAQNHFQQGLTELGIDKMPKSSILSLEDGTGEQKFLSSFIQQQWQTDLKFSINIESLEESAFYARIASGDFQVAILPFVLSDSNPAIYLSKLLPYLEDSSVPFRTASHRFQIEEYLTRIHSSKSISEAAETLSKAEDYLLQNALAVPLYYESSFFATKPEVSGIYFTPYPGHIFFQHARKS